MKNKITNKIKMYNMVKTVCAQHQSVWDGTPAFVEAHTTFSEKLSLLKEQSSVQESVVSGVTVNKKEILNKAVTIASTTSKAISAFALKTGDHELLARNLYTYSEWFRGNAMLRVSRMTTLLQDVDDHSAELEDYGIDAAFVAELQARIADYKASAQAPRLAILERKRATAALDRLTSEIDSLLNGQLDGIIEIFRVDEPDFVENYFNARIVVDLKGKRRGTSASDSGDTPKEPGEEDESNGQGGFNE